MLNKAIILATTFHAGQKDKAGEPYILHPLAVMLKMDTDEERTVAVLHDILEDTIITEKFLRSTPICNDKQKFPDSVINAVVVLTKIVGESNIQYYTRIKKNPLALKVKLADIKHNLEENRLNKLPYDVKSRLINKYNKALDYLE